MGLKRIQEGLQVQNSFCPYLLGQGRELENVERLVKAGRVLVDVDNHRDPTSSTEKELQEVGQFGLSERDVVLEPGPDRDVFTDSGAFMDSGKPPLLE